MAISFNGVNQWLRQIALGMPTTFPVSMFIRAYSNDINNEGYPMQALYNPLVDANFTPGFRGDVVGDPLLFRRGYPGSTSGVLSGTYTAGQWITYGAVARNLSSASQYIDGVRTDNTASSTPFPGIDEINHGIFNGGGSGLSAPLNGAVFAGALWAAELNDDEFNSLHKGFSPRRIRPQSLRYYAPLIRNPFDWISGDIPPMQVTGTPGNVDTPRAYGF